MHHDTTVYILGRFPPPPDGQTLATRRLAELLGDGHAVHCLSTSAPASDFVEAEVRFRPGRVRHYALLLPRLRRALRTAPTAPVLWASISPTWLGHLRDLLTTLPAFQPQQAVFAVIHRGNFEQLFQSPLTTLTARRLVGRLQGVVFLNALLADRCTRWIPHYKRFIIPNTVDEAVRCSDAEIQAKQADRRGRHTLRLLFLSNMIPSKGYLDVLHALPMLRARGVSVQADFAGGWTSGSDRAAFEKVVAAQRLQEVVVHHGPLQDRTRIKDLYRRADVFLLPTSYPTEAQPLSIIEALGAGTPVITTRHSGIPEMVGDTEALFVPPNDPAAIADAVAQLLAYPRWKALSDGARRRFQEHFSPEVVRHKWEALLRSKDALSA